jgi:hypothetical protein
MPDNYYPCPACGGKSARIVGAPPEAGRLALIVEALLGWVRQNDLTPNHRECYDCSHRWPQPPPAPFTSEELGYDPNARD